MIIELPRRVLLYYLNRKIRIKGGILVISKLESWREVAYDITKASKGRRCWYCGKKLKKDEITMDHLFPQYLGGPTIPSNLAPTCSKCNSQKGNLTEYQYRQIVNAPQKKRKYIKEIFLNNNEKRKRKNGFYLPRKWITTRKIDNILVTFHMMENYKGKKYKKIEEFYNKYERFPYPIIVDKNNYLLDGFLILMFAKNNEIKRVPTIVLENVEVKLRE